MRNRKIRGHKRRLKQIERWRLENLSLDLTDYLLNERNSYFAKIRVNPWSGISMTNSVIPMPTRKTKLKMLNGLLDIYDNWKQQLDKLGQPYYLKLWLFEPRFSQSQVVCAIDDRIDYYETNFFQPDKNKSFKPENFGQIKDRLKKYNWNYALDEDNYANSDVGEPEDYASRQDYTDSIKWFKKLLNNPHRTTNLKEPIGETTEVYSFRRGDLWIGC